MSNIQWIVALIWILGITVSYQYELAWIDLESEEGMEKLDRHYNLHFVMLGGGIFLIVFNARYIHFLGSFFSLYLFAFLMYFVVDYFFEDEEEKEEEK